MQYSNWSRSLAIAGFGLLMAADADAARRADLDVSAQGPTQVNVSDSATYSATARNVGNRTARGATMTVNVPASLTITNHSSECQASASGLDCDLGKIRAGRSHTVTLVVDAPAAPGAHALSVSANTTTRESSLANNTATLTVQVIDPTPPPPAAFPITSQTDLFLEMCTSLSGPIVWSDCTPGSLLTHTVTLLPGGSVDTYDPGVWGTWTQSNASEIEMNFFNALDNSPMSTMSGTATSSTCFEGTTVFHQGLGDGAWQGCAP